MRLYFGTVGEKGMLFITGAINVMYVAFTNQHPSSLILLNFKHFGDLLNFTQFQTIWRPP